MSVNMVPNNNSSRQMYQQKQALIDRNFKKIYAHELAHQRAGGSFAGSIVIEKDSEGIPVGGHVDIKMPTLDKDDPQKTINHADTVIASAMAPGDPSPQDYRVANQALEIKRQAMKIKNTNPHAGKKLDIQG